MKINFKDFGISKQILSVSIGLSVVVVIFLIVFSSLQVVKNKNEIKATTVKNRATAVIEKIDRNFYERFGDVQAFAYNKLAVQMIDSAKATEDAQQFLNTMTSYYVLYDLMFVVDKKGKVVAVNTTDKNGGSIATDMLIGEDFSSQPWFRSCMSSTGPEGGAWYSDFMVDPLVAKIYGTNGWGMGFAAPIRNAEGKAIGAWYNFASWKDVTQGIRTETEELLRMDDPGTFMLITDKKGNVIDADDESLVGDFQFDETSAQNGIEFKFHGKTIDTKDFVIGSSQGKGAYTYKGNDWKAVCFIPKNNFTLSVVFGELKFLTLFIVLILTGGIMMFLLLARNISGRISGLRKIIYEVSRGELVLVDSTVNKDEIAQMTNSVKELTDGLKRTSNFANEIGNGNLNIEHEPMSDKDVLGLSLIAMRDNLLKVKAEDEKRKWLAQGLADLGDRLRKNSGSISDLSEDVVSFLCKYLEANQAALFIQNENSQEELDLKACYAWNRKKHMNMKINDEGLVSQAWKEGEMILLKEIPTNFVKITSGLGEANPKAILLMPLLYNEEKIGVLEIASLKTFEAHEIEYIKKAAESIASTVSAVRVNERTKKLLEATQEQAEQMRSQEEEMRQSMEELQATQEESYRKEQEYIARLQKLETMLKERNGHNHSMGDLAMS